MGYDIGAWYFYLVACSLGLTGAVMIIGTERILNLRYYATAFLGVMTLTYVFRPVLAFTVGHGFTLFEHVLPGISKLMTQDVYMLALIYSISIMFFAIGYRQFPRSMTTNQDVNSRHNLQNKMYKQFALLLITIGYGSFLFSHRGIAGVRESTVNFIQSGEGAGYANTTGYIELANYFVVSGTFLYYASTGRLFNSIFWAAPWTFNQIYLGWARNMFYALVLGLFGIWLIQSVSRRVSRYQGIFVVVLVTFASFLLLTMRANRHFIKSDQSLFDIAKMTMDFPVDQSLGDFSGIEGTWYTYRSLGYNTPRYGSSIIFQLFVKPIPRILWVGKPYPGDFSWRNLFGFTSNSNLNSRIGGGPFSLDESTWFTGFMKGSIGSAMAEFGWLGIPINFMIVGLFLAWIESRTFGSNGSPPWIAAYAATYGMVALLGRAAIFGVHLINYILLFYLPYLFIHRWVTNRKKRQASDNLWMHNVNLKSEDL